MDPARRATSSCVLLPARGLWIDKQSGVGLSERSRDGSQREVGGQNGDVLPSVLPKPILAGQVRMDADLSS